MKECKYNGAWHDGSCCCNCQHQLNLFKHPWNKEVGQGSINEQMGYVCTAFDEMDNSKQAIFFEHKHGMCELHKPLTER